MNTGLHKNRAADSLTDNKTSSDRNSPFIYERTLQLNMY